MACSVKALAKKENNSVRPTARFFSGKMLMFAKLSLKSFIYELIETMYFPNKETNKIFEKYAIEYVYPYHVLTDTDSTSIQFLFVCKNDDTIEDSKYRDVIFEVICKNKVLERFNTSHTFCEKLSVRDESLKNKIGYFEVEHIDDPCYVTIAVNPEGHIKKFESDKINKKHKDLKKGSRGMDIQNFGKRINPVKDIQKFFVVKNNEMSVQEICTNKPQKV